MEKSDERQVIAVTGAGRGIGRAVSRALAQVGESVLEVDQEFPTRAEDHSATLEMDVTSDDAAESIVTTAKSEFGRLDGLVNCAGIFPTRPALDITSRDWDDLMNVNLRAPFFLSQGVARYLVSERRSGAIVNVASTAAEITRPGIAHYSASKAALTMLTKTLAIEWAQYGIRVNAVAPGLVETPGVDALTSDESGEDEHRRKIENIPAGRPGEPEEIAEAVLFLLSGRAGYVTGHTLVVDGGYSTGRLIGRRNVEESSKTRGDSGA